MRKALQSIEAFVRHAYVELVVGLVLFSTSLIEAGDTLFEDLTGGDVGAHHGVMVLGLVHAFKAVPSILGGLFLVAEGAEHDAERE